MANQQYPYYDANGQGYNPFSGELPGTNPALPSNLNPRYATRRPPPGTAMTPAAAPAPEAPPAAPPAPATPSVAQSWSPAAASTPPAWQQPLVDRMVQETAAPAGPDRSTALYDTLLSRMTQNVVPDANDPVIGRQTDAYRAEQDRSARNYVADQAEKLGPNANLRGEQRMASERAGQNTGAFRADLVNREMTARRDEIKSALATYAGVLTADQQRDLQQELGLLEQAMAQQELTSNREQDWMTALLQNEQFNADLGLRAEDRSSYWDAVRRGYNFEG